MDIKADKTMKEAMAKITRDLEESLYFGGAPRHEVGLRVLLKRFGIKTVEAATWYGSPLAAESIEAVMKSVTFNMDTLTKWK